MKKLTNMVRNLKVKRKLGMLTRFLIGALILNGVLGAFFLYLFKITAAEISDKWMPASVLVEKMDTATSDYRLAQYAHLTAVDEQQMAEFEQNLYDRQEEMTNLTQQYAQYATSDEEKQMFADTEQIWEEYREIARNVLALSSAGEIAQAGEIMIGEGLQVYNDFETAFNKLIAYNEQQSTRSVNTLNIAFILGITILAVVIVFSTINSMILAGIVRRDITNPLVEVMEVLTAISSGDFSKSIGYQSKDEFGELSEAVNHFVDDLKDIIADENYLLLEMADGNFDIASKQTQKYIGDFEPLLTSIRSINRKLGNAMSRIAESTNQVTVASEQMAAEAQILAEGATEQASTVEELLATVEEVTEQSVHSAGQAQEASADASEAKNRAENSNGQMNEMINAMNNINETSKEISTIIETIESIASQTNLLSLNASIEAARAGEAGRGFAVVADEIGKLALQCSEAAGNTRRLIEMARQQAENGDKIAKITAEDLTSVTEGIIKVVTMVEEVKNNCNSQAESMRQIDKGIEIISKVVEGNSAAAQESSAASEELAAHAENLQEQMSAFKFRANA